PDRRRAAGRLAPAEMDRAGARLAKALAGVELHRLARPVFERVVRPLPPLGTLDAIHLATALILRERMGLDVEAVATHDQEMAEGARALGFGVLRHPGSIT